MVPKIPSSMMKSAQSFIGNMDQASSVAEFDMLQANVDATLDTAGLDLEQAETVRGAALRELERFFAANDPHCTFASLQRVCTPEGVTCWTSQEQVASMLQQQDGIEGDVAVSIAPVSTPTPTASTVPMSIASTVGGTSSHSILAKPPAGGSDAPDTSMKHVLTILQSQTKAIQQQQQMMDQQATLLTRLAQQSDLFNGIVESASANVGHASSIVSTESHGSALDDRLNYAEHEISSWFSLDTTWPQPSAAEASSSSFHEDTDRTRLVEEVHHNSMLVRQLTREVAAMKGQMKGREAEVQESSAGSVLPFSMCAWWLSQCPCYGPSP